MIFVLLLSGYFSTISQYEPVKTVIYFFQRTKKNSEQDVEKFRKVMDAHKNVNSDLRSVVKCKLNIPLGRKKINYMCK